MSLLRNAVSPCESDPGRYCRPPRYHCGGFHPHSPPIQSHQDLLPVTSSIITNYSTHTNETTPPPSPIAKEQFWVEYQPRAQNKNLHVLGGLTIQLESVADIQGPEPISSRAPATRRGDTDAPSTLDKVELQVPNIAKPPCPPTSCNTTDDLQPRKTKKNTKNKQTGSWTIQTSHQTIHHLTFIKKSF